MALSDVLVVIVNLLGCDFDFGPDFTLNMCVNLGSSNEVDDRIG